MLNRVKHLLADMHSLQTDPSLSLRMTNIGYLNFNLLKHSAINRDYLPGDVASHI